MLMLRSSVQAELYPGFAGGEAVQYFERTNREFIPASGPAAPLTTTLSG